MSAPLAHMTAAQEATYRGWLTGVAARAKGRMRDHFTRQLSELSGNEWGFLP